MKTVKHSTAPKKISKKIQRKELDNELSLSFSDKRYWPVTPEALINLGKDLLLMFKEDKKMTSVLPWRQKHDISARQVDHYCEKCPELKAMIEEFEDLSGWRLFDKALYREVDSNIATKGMTMYNGRYRKAEEWRNNLKKELSAAAQPTTINVITPEFPSSGKVPDRVTKDKND